MRKVFTRLLLLIAMLGLTGCYTSLYRIYVNADGSGTLEVTHTASPALLAQLQQNGVKVEDQFFKKEDLIRTQAIYGQGVKFAKRNVLDVPNGRMFVVTYTFDDINDLHLSPDRNQQHADQKYRFEYKNGTLAIHSPVIAPPKKAEPDAAIMSPDAKATQQALFQKNLKKMMGGGNPFKLDGTETQVDLTRKLLSGLRFQVQVQPSGKIMGSTASHLAKGPRGEDRVVLLDLNMDKLMENADFNKSISDQNLKLDTATLVNMKGCIIEKRRTIRIRFEGGPPPADRLRKKEDDLLKTSEPVKKGK